MDILMDQETKKLNPIESSSLSALNFAALPYLLKRQFYSVSVNFSLVNSPIGVCHVLRNNKKGGNGKKYLAKKDIKW